jgi:raffinose/stachyose/melibiose transport system substrate-binding protein
LIDLKPFQDGFLGASHDDMQGTFGNGKAAMELSGQWAPGSSKGQSADEKGVANLGMFTFPAVEGGKGDLLDAMGGGNGFAIGKNASPEAIDFVKYLTAAEQQERVAASGGGIPVVKGGEAFDRSQHDRCPGRFRGCGLLPALLRSIYAIGDGWDHQ